MGELFSYTLRSAWETANTLVESSDVQWAYLRCDGTSDAGAAVNTYHEKLRLDEPSDPTQSRTFYWLRGTC